MATPEDRRHEFQHYATIDHDLSESHRLHEEEINVGLSNNVITSPCTYYETINGTAKTKNKLSWVHRIVRYLRM